MGSETFLEKATEASPEMIEKIMVRAATASEDELMESIGKTVLETQTIAPSEVGDISEVLGATEVAAASPKQGKPTDVVGNVVVPTPADYDGI